MRHMIADRNELISAEAYEGTCPVTNDWFAYVYDPIGSRTSSTAGVSVVNYRANNLNQYTNIVQEGEAPAEPSYDADGNLTNACQAEGMDGSNVYFWNAENRLTVVSNASTLATFAYDYMGRRIRKIVYTNDSGWTALSTNTFFYDGWNLIQEFQLSAFSTQVFSYVWGPDLSCTLQGAGGIGGLLSMTRITGSETNTYLYCYDANGNVVNLVDADDGSLAATYEYDPFGNIVSQTGTAADDNPFRFSTKYHDDETGLVYYGYRYYSPELGRWLRRDPIGERGGLNLYGFVRNAPLRYVDPFGAWETDIASPEVVRTDEVGSGDYQPHATFSCACEGAGARKEVQCKLTARPVVRLHTSDAFLAEYAEVNHPGLTVRQHEFNHHAVFAHDYVGVYRILAGLYEHKQCCNCEDLAAEAEAQFEVVRGLLQAWENTEHMYGEPNIDYGSGRGRFVGQLRGSLIDLWMTLPQSQCE